MGLKDSGAVAAPFAEHNASIGDAYETAVSPQMPEPLVPANADLRNLEYMPLLGGRLFGSAFDLAASDAEWRAAVTLWWVAWRQVPAGSLPADDRTLARLAGFGYGSSANRAWSRIKSRATHGFVLCTDGRLYHRVLCDQVRIALDKRVKELDRKAKWREKERVKRLGHNDAETGTRHSGDALVPPDGTIRYETGRDVKALALDSSKRLARTNDTQAPTLAEQACALMADAGCESVNASDLDLLAALAEGVTPEALKHTAVEAVKAGDKTNPFRWAIQAARGRHAKGARTIAGEAAVQQRDRKFWRAKPKPENPEGAVNLGERLSALVRSLSGGAS